MKRMIINVCLCLTLFTSHGVKASDAFEHQAPLADYEQSSKRVKMSKGTDEPWYPLFLSHIEKLDAYKNLSPFKQDELIEESLAYTLQDSLFNVGKALMFDEFDFQNSPKDACQIWGVATQLGHRDSAVFRNLLLNRKLHGITTLERAWGIYEDDQYFHRLGKVFSDNPQQAKEMWQSDSRNGSEKAMILEVLDHNGMLVRGGDFEPMGKRLCLLKDPQEAQTYITLYNKYSGLSRNGELSPSDVANHFKMLPAQYLSTMGLNSLQTAFEANLFQRWTTGSLAGKVGFQNVWEMIYLYFARHPQHPARDIKLLSRIPFGMIVGKHDVNSCYLKVNPAYADLLASDIDRTTQAYNRMVQEGFFKVPAHWLVSHIHDVKLMHTLFHARDEAQLNQFLDNISCIRWAKEKRDPEPAVHANSRHARISYFFSMTERAIYAQDMQFVQYLLDKRIWLKGWRQKLFNFCMEILSKDNAPKALEGLKLLIDEKVFNRFNSFASWQTLKDCFEKSPQNVVRGVLFMKNEGILRCYKTGSEIADTLRAFVFREEYMQEVLGTLRSDDLWFKYVEPTDRTAVYRFFKAINHENHDLMAYINFCKTHGIWSYCKVPEDVINLFGLLECPPHCDLYSMLKILKTTGFFEKNNWGQYLYAVENSLRSIIYSDDPTIRNQFGIVDIEEFANWSYQARWLNYYLPLALGCDTPIIEALNHTDSHWKSFQKIKDHIDLVCVNVPAK